MSYTTREKDICEIYNCKRKHKVEFAIVDLPTDAISKYHLKQLERSGYTGPMPRKYCKILYKLLEVPDNVTLLYTKIASGMGFRGTDGKTYSITKAMKLYLGDYWWQYTGSLYPTVTLEDLDKIKGETK